LRNTALNTTVVWLVAVVFIGVVLTAMSRQGMLSPVEGAAGTVFSPVQEGLRTIFSPITNVLSDIGDADALREENQSLREDNARLNAELVRLRELSSQEKELSALLDVVRERTDFRFQVAQVIHADPSNQRQITAINLGSDDGIKLGMVVAGPGGSLIGRITKVLPNYSWVTLISDPRSSVNAEIQGAGVRGVVTGQPDFSLSMELVQGGSPVQVGDKVVTSGLGGNFPSTLYVGIVSEVRGVEQDITLDIEVEPAVRLDQVENVLVITNFVPLSVEEDE
jgi:rod shape-determining protein MreC